MTPVNSPTSRVILINKDNSSRIDIHSFIQAISIVPLHSFIHHGDLYSASSRLLHRSTPTLARLKRRVLGLSRMCQKESWGGIIVTKKAHSTQRGQPPRMHGPGLWRYESSSPLLLVGAPDTARLLCRNFTPKRHRQL